MVGHCWKPPRRTKGRRWLGRAILLALILAVAVAVVVPRAHSGVRPGEAVPMIVAAQSVEDAPTVDVDNPKWKVNVKERVSACDNRPGLKKIYVKVFDDKGEPMRGIVVRFDTHPSEGIAYDHMFIWGYTNKNGYIEWDHLGVPTRYMLFMEDDKVPLVENIRTDLGNEYCIQRAGYPWSTVPINRPGIYSYRIEIQQKGLGD